MAQLRQDYQQFTDRNVIVLVVGPDDQAAFQDYWTKNDLPFIGLPDPEHVVLNLYQQQVKLLRFGRMPAMAVIDKNGFIRYKHFGDSMRDIASNQQVLAVLDQINLEDSVG